MLWYVVMRNKITKKIIAQYCGPDHPCMPQNKDPEEYPHPWVEHFNETQHEIIYINPDENVLEEIRSLRADGNRSRLEVIDQEFDLDDTVEPAWPTEKVTVGLPPDWQDIPIGDTIKPIKKVIPKPAYAKTAVLKIKGGLK